MHGSLGGLRTVHHGELVLRYRCKVRLCIALFAVMFCIGYLLSFVYAYGSSALLQTVVQRSVYASEALLYSSMTSGVACLSLVMCYIGL